MDKRLFDKSSNFFKKEGFYVILFVCLCVVATVAAVTARNNRAAKDQQPVVEQPADKTNTNVATNTGDEPKKEVNNAQSVKKPDIDVPKDGAAAVSKTVDTKFAKPVDGALVRAYTTETVQCSTLGVYKTVNGVDIKAAAGKPVFAVLDGKVEAVGNDKTELGQYIIINHQNGVKTIYANLEEKVTLKKGDSVKKGAQIGKVGNTRGNFSEEPYGAHLHFQVMKGNDYVDPAKYVTYEIAKN